MSERWPSILYPQEVDCFLAPMVAMGPAATSGLRQSIGTDAGYWKMTLSGVPIRTPDQVREWRGIIAALQGGLVDVIISPFDCRQSPRIDGVPLFIEDIPHSDESLFSDDSGYLQSSLIVILTEDHYLRDTHLTCQVVQAGPLRRGMYFSIDSRLYIITSPPVVDGDIVEFDFLPPLRADVSGGVSIELARPVGTFRLASPETGRLPLRLGRLSSPSVELSESFRGL